MLKLATILTLSLQTSSYTCASRAGSMQMKAGPLGRRSEGSALKSTTRVPLTMFWKTWRTMGTALSVLKKVRKAEELMPVSISGRSVVWM